MELLSWLNQVCRPLNLYENTLLTRSQLTGLGITKVEQCGKGECWIRDKDTKRQYSHARIGYPIAQIFDSIYGKFHTAVQHEPKIDNFVQAMWS